MNEPTRHVLAADDEEGDRLIMQVAFRKAAIPYPLALVHDGQEAIDYLSGAPPYAGRPLPALLLLDLKMPRATGFDVLTWLAQRPDLAGLPVVVVSSSAHDQDVQRARALGAKDYLVKTPRIDDFAGALRAVCDTWVRTGQSDRK